MTPRNVKMPKLAHVLSAVACIAVFAVAPLRAQLRVDITEGDRQHRKAQLLEADKNLIIAADRIETFGYETEVVDRVFHADETGRGSFQLDDAVDAHGDRGPSRNMIDHPGCLMVLSQLEIILHQAALRRADIIGRDDQERVDAGGDRMGRQLFAFGERLGPGGGDDRQPPGGRLNRDVDQLVALVRAQARRLRRGAVDQDAVAAVFDLEIHQPPVTLVVHVTVPERRDQRRDRALDVAQTESHMVSPVWLLDTVGET